MACRSTEYILGLEGRVLGCARLAMGIFGTKRMGNASGLDVDQPIARLGHARARNWVNGAVS